jgi:hypothetical protein
MTTEEKIKLVADLARSEGKHEVTILLADGRTKVEIGYLTSDSHRWVHVRVAGEGETLDVALTAALRSYVKSGRDKATLLYQSAETTQKAASDIRHTANMIEEMLR